MQGSGHNSRPTNHASHIVANTRRRGLSDWARRNHADRSGRVVVQWRPDFPLARLHSRLAPKTPRGPGVRSAAEDGSLRAGDKSRLHLLPRQPRVQCPEAPMDSLDVSLAAASIFLTLDTHYIDEPCQILGSRPPWQGQIWAVQDVPRARSHLCPLRPYRARNRKDLDSRCVLHRCRNAQLSVTHGNFLF